MSAARASSGAEAPSLKLPAYVILGVLRLGAQSGYDIKQMVDLSGRHFWTINYPQIYPALTHLEQAGLVTGQTDRKSGRRRMLWRLTRAGEKELERWLADSSPASLEIRDVGLLKVMFSESPAAARDQLGAIRQRSEETIRQLEESSRPRAEALAEEDGNPFPALTVEFGVEVHRGIIRACRKFERELAE